MKITTLVCRVGKPPAVEEIDTDLEAVHALVGGYVEERPLDNGVYLLCNEEGQMLGLPFNRNVPGRRAPMPAMLASGDVSFIVDRTNGGSKPAPGEMGVHKVVGDFVLVRHDSNGEWAGLSPAEVRMWTAALDMANASA